MDKQQAQYIYDTREALYQVRYAVEWCATEEELLTAFDNAYPDELEKKFVAACALMAFESHERYADAGPVQVGIVGGEVMEFGKQRGVTQIPF